MKRNLLKVALDETFPYIIVIGVIGLGLYLNALIVQDTITLRQAEIIGYVLLTILITLEIVSLIFLKTIEVEKRTLISTIADKDKKIEEFEKELERLKIED